LNSLLPEDLDSLYNASANYTIGTPDGFEFIDGKTHETLGIVGNVKPSQLGHNISASRDLFRKILMKHIDITYGKRFMKYEENKNTVEILFQDGTRATGDLLVGADGANSAVRGQLIEGFKATPSSLVTLHGNTVLDKKLYEPLIEKGNTGVIVGQDGPSSPCYCWSTLTTTRHYSTGFAPTKAKMQRAKIDGLIWRARKPCLRKLWE